MNKGNSFFIKKCPMEQIYLEPMQTNVIGQQLNFLILLSDCTR